MPNTRFEIYDRGSTPLPYVLHDHLERTALKRSDAHNWHEALEIQWCTEGEGYVLLNGDSIPFQAGDVIVINSDLLHYTGTATRLVYHCVIIDAAFCRQMQLDHAHLQFKSSISDPSLFHALCTLQNATADPSLPFSVAYLHQLLLSILLHLAQHHSMPTVHSPSDSKPHAHVKQILRYIREHFSEKITLSHLEAELFLDKHTLCRDFKQITGTTIIEYLNQYRCQQAASLLQNRLPAARAAEQCGFSDPAYFSRIFKRYMGVSPSLYR